MHFLLIFSAVGLAGAVEPDLLTSLASSLVVATALLHWITRHKGSARPDQAEQSMSGTDLYPDPADLASAYDALSEYVDHHAALNRIERTILEDTSLEDTVEVALAQLVEMIPCDRASVTEYDAIMNEGYLVGQCGYGLGNEVQSVSSAPLDLLTECDFTPGDHYVADLTALRDPSPIEHTLSQQGLRSYYRCSLTVQGRVVGSLNVASAMKDGISQDDQWVVRDIADLLSTAFRQHLHQIDRAWYETELIVARDRAQELARMKSAFLAVMTHELRTPLSGILGCAQILDEEVAPEHQEFSGLIGDAAKRLLGTINSVLDLSRLEAGQQSLMLRRTDAAKVAADCVRLLEPLARKRNIDLKLESRDGIWAMLDGSAVHRILNNLIGNAIKFTSDGTITVRIRMCEQRVCIEVADTGTGISEDFLPHIFDEFRQEHQVSEAHPEGSGLGLAITKRLVQNMDGRISVQSVKGEGSTFRVEFPVVSEAAAAQADPGVQKAWRLAREPGSSRRSGTPTDAAAGKGGHQSGRFRSVA